MTSLVPDRWKEELQRVNDKIGHFLAKLAPLKKLESSPEKITADTMPAFIQLGGPLLDMHESESELIIHAEVPGLDKDDLSVEVIGNRLTMRGVKKSVLEQKGGDGYFISECHYGSFARTVQLPYEMDERSIKADLSNGVLTIRLAKPEEERYRRYRVPIF